MINHTEPVTAGRAAGGRPRRRKPPSNPFAAWLKSQARPVADVATELGISRWTVYKLREGSHQPRLGLAQAIAVMSAGAVPESSWRKPKSKRRRD